ncbi:hypothetical protein FC59_GL000130 [Lactobacillus kitasatonis DSM 16761 = JCM 1039]|uniref:Gram-positive cocci surface proteins LPxTG domain-containing protein n=1 Tax=Lactobacillus kitasatonis DSM 16761 = JCM 1039 TaxID=1423767 RepID=A0A0R1VNV4_9LACO|nr:hypothetical protein FC59_GL000130 [Lactobacillus kitasatonis DSM 16761 = JCM 1039]
MHLQQLLSQIFLRLQIQLQKLILLIQFNQLIRQWFQTLLRLNLLRQKRLSITNQTLPSLFTVRLQSKKQKHGHDYNYTTTPKATSIHTNKSTVQPKSQVKEATKVANNKVASPKKNTLPQTGESKSSLGLLGLGFVAVASLLGLTINRRRKN